MLRKSVEVESNELVAGFQKSYACNVRQGWYVVRGGSSGDMVVVVVVLVLCLRDQVWSLLEREC